MATIITDVIQLNHCNIAMCAHVLAQYLIHALYWNFSMHKTVHKGVYFWYVLGLTRTKHHSSISCIISEISPEKNILKSSTPAVALPLVNQRIPNLTYVRLT